MAHRGHAFLGAIAALVALELIVRQVYCLRQVVEPNYGLITAPGTTVAWGREGHGTSHWTLGGLRAANPPMPGSPVLLVLGDSQTEALMVDDDDVFTSLLERALRATHFPAATVLNAGRSSASMADYVAHAARFENTFHPNWVFLILQESDLLDDSFEAAKTHFVRGPRGSLEAVFVPPTARSRLGSFFWDVRQRSMLVGYAITRLGEFRAASAFEPPLFFSDSQSHAPATLPRSPDFPVEEELDLAASTYQGRVSFILLASFNLEAPDRRTALEHRFLGHCANARLHCSSTREDYREIAERGHAPYGHANTRFNYGHLNREGHRAVADALTQHVHQLEADGLL